MPVDNQFAHQCYSAQPPVAPYELLAVGSQPRIGSPEYVLRMESAGRSLKSSDVGAIVLLHGTFIGYDPTGFNTMLFSMVPPLKRLAYRLTKASLDMVLRDVGNYSKSSVRRLASHLHTDHSIQVHRFIWSGMNNHAGRAVAAVRLIDFLVGLKLPAGKRILLCGHSHGGNVLALLTNLLAENRGGVAEFVAAIDGYAHKIDKRWPDIKSLVQSPARPLKKNPLDLVTLGMPIRYGFESTGYERLMHFVNHRPRHRLPEYRVARAGSLRALFPSLHCDFVQQLGVAGSNSPNPFDGTMWTADRRLAKLLEPGFSCWSLSRQIRKGMLVPEEGQTLLVDYEQSAFQWLRHMWGHLIYTRSHRMLFHIEQIVRCFYASAD